MGAHDLGAYARDCPLILHRAVYCVETSEEYYRQGTFLRLAGCETPEAMKKAAKDSEFFSGRLESDDEAELVPVLVQSDWLPRDFWL